MSPTSPIVVLDSGLGGLTVAKAIRAALPHERLVYFGDTARLPYGSKSAAAVTGFVREILSFLRPMRPKHVVFACNTATALALPALRGAYPELTFSGVIDPGPAPPPPRRGASTGRRSASSRPRRPSAPRRTSAPSTAAAATSASSCRRPRRWRH